MANYLDQTGLAYLLGKFIDGTIVVGKSDSANSADSVAAANISGILSLSQLPKGAVERCVVVADDTARYALTTNDVQVGDTVKVTSTGKMYFVVDDTHLSTDAGYEIYTAGTATLAEEATKVTYPLVISLNGSTGGTFDGHERVEINITPVSIGAATSSQGTKADTAVQTIKIGTETQTKSEGVVTLPAYPTTLPASDVSAWAKAANKPTYDATEVALSGYTKPSSAGAVGSTDTLQVAIGKLEKSLDTKQGTLVIDSTPASGSTNPISSGGVYTALENKVDKISGKGLSENDYTTTEKTKLSGIAANATSDSAISTSTIDSLISNAMS